MLRHVARLALLAGLTLGLACQRAMEPSPTESTLATQPTSTSGMEPTPSGAESLAAHDLGSDPAEEPAEPGATLSDFAISILAAHNRVREGARPSPETAIPPLQWSAELASLAQAWADTCPEGHRPDTDYGENIFWSGGEPTRPEVAVESWADEAGNYDYASTACLRGGHANWAYCGHYTQVVWRDTRRVGCGSRTDCPGAFETVVVCNYDPPGNVGTSARRIPRPY